MVADVNKVLLGMSGGIDSSVAAHYLKSLGYEVVGLTLLTGSITDQTAERARIAADRAGIDLIVKEMRSQFEQIVIDPFIDSFAMGLTPNPCVLCNPDFKFKVLAEEAARLGAGLIATGHYARIILSNRDKWIARGSSQDNDQSYFLYRLPKEIRDLLLFPLGCMDKPQIRDLAGKIGLDYSDVKSSQEACFIRGELRCWLKDKRPNIFSNGYAYDMSGNLIGEHGGAAGFTIGQRKGHGISTGKRAYICRIEYKENAIFLGTREDCMTDSICAGKVVFGSKSPKDFEKSQRLLARARSSMAPVPALVTLKDGILCAKMDDPTWASAPGQSLVCYDGETVACGGIIE
jgi:tRNA-specific 2-thiouridylase